ncbi:MAG: hypothetical protein ACLR2O_04680 [Coprococcus sp.]
MRHKDIEVTYLRQEQNVDLLEKQIRESPAKSCGNVDRREGKGTGKAGSRIWM